MTERSKKSDREKMTFNIPVETKARARAAVYHTPGLTLDALVDIALNNVIDALEKKRGEKFSNKAIKLHAGRPIRLDGL